MIWYRSQNTFYTLPSPRCQSVLNYPLHAMHHSWHLDTRFLVPGAKYQQDIWETNLIPAPACRELLCCKSSALLTKPRPVQIKSKKFKFGYNIPLWPPWHQYFIIADTLEAGMANLIDQHSSAFIWGSFWGDLKVDKPGCVGGLTPPYYSLITPPVTSLSKLSFSHLLSNVAQAHFSVLFLFCFWGGGVGIWGVLSI